jgi:pyruvate dehydrogenase E2 component (dihydrolipoamide acetyltransferase)
VPVGTVLVSIGGEATDASDRDASEGQSLGPVQTEQGRARATPLVRKVAQELGVEIDGLTGTGPQGRITEEDVRAAASGDAAAEGRREPLRGVRRVIAEHMTRAHREVPPVTWVEECDFDSVDLDRLVATVVKACADELRAFPELNARLERDAIVYLERYDIGVAVQTPQGLMVPVVRACHTKTVEEIHAELAALAERGRAGSLAPAELRGSTFTVTSAGKLGGLLSTPIVNHPEVAILSVGRIADRPVVRDGQVVVRRVGTICVTFDHRVIDGARAAEFGLAVIARIESGADA